MILSNLSHLQGDKSRWFRSFLKGYRICLTYGVIYRMIPVIGDFGLQNQLLDKIYMHTSIRDK